MRERNDARAKRSRDHEGERKNESWSLAEMRRNFLRTCRGRVPAIFACDTRKGKSYQYHLRKSHDVIEMRVSEEDRDDDYYFLCSWNKRWAGLSYCQRLPKYCADGDCWRSAIACARCKFIFGNAVG